jgi:cobalt-zinc-cadmium efflux system outer membrane protein
MFIDGTEGEAGMRNHARRAKRAHWACGSALAVIVSLPISLLAQQPPALPAPSIPNNLSLQQAEQLLLQRSLIVQAARFQVTAGRAAKLIAGYKPNPTITIGAEQFTLSNKFLPNIVTTDPNVAAQTTYTLRYDTVFERGGKRELRAAQADAQLQANEAQMLDAIRQQLFQLRQAFTTAALAHENLTLAEATNEQYDQTIRLTAAKVDNGDLAGVELYRVQASALPYQQAVQQAETTYQQATRDILNVLGARVQDLQSAPPAAPARASGSASQYADARGIAVSLPQGAPRSVVDEGPLSIVFDFDDRPIPQTLAELRDMAMAQRPDLIAARRLYDVAMQGVNLAESQRVRDLSTGVFFQRIGSDQTLGVNLSVPLLIHNNGLAAVTQADALKSAGEAVVRQAEFQVAADVEKAYLAYQSARRVLDLYNTTTMERAGRLRTIAAVSYQQGVLGLLELLDAQRTYNQTATAYNQARSDYQMALWQLEQATGSALR